MSDLGQVAFDAAALGSLYALLALGLSVVFGVMGLVNFAFGELIMVAGYTLYITHRMPLALSVVAALGAAMLTALLMERIAFRPLRTANQSAMLVTSFALSVLLQNCALVIFGGLAKTTNVAPWLSNSASVLGQPVPILDFVTSATAVTLTVALVILLRRTDVGLQMRAAAIDFDMARALGVRANRVIATAFAVSGILAGAAAVLLVAQTGTLTPQMGLQPVLIAFVSVVVGGMSRLSGAALGGFVIGCATAVLQTYLPQELRSFRDAFLFGAVIVTLVVRPKGLFVSGEPERV